MMYKINEIDNFKYITFPILERYDDLVHCFTTRYGGVSKGCYESMNLGTGTDDNPEDIKRNYEILSEKMNINLNDMVKTYQTHTSNIRYVTDSDKGRGVVESAGYTDVDGLITDKKNIALITTHADCTPLFFYDNVKKTIGMAHAGWRGTIKNIAANMIYRFVNDFDSNPGDINVVIGPSLGQCCFEVDKDVAEMFIEENPIYEDFMKTKGDKYYFDLWSINEYIMMELGVKQENICISGLCTKCNNDMFFSHRGQQGKRGIMAGVIMMR